MLFLFGINKEDEYIIRFEIFDDNGTKIKVI